MVETVSPGSTTGTKVLYYGYQDHLGSLTALVRERVNGNGNGSISKIVADYRSYDAWGRLRENDDWTLPRTDALQITDRGYTGHEHLTDFGIINMNGRVYDPLTAQFFSPDPYIQAPDSWLNYNRYAYCLNNPLIYTDPSGESISLGLLLLYGGGMSLLSQVFSGGINSIEGGCFAFGIGAMSSIIGSFFMVNGLPGILRSGLNGFVSGFSSGMFSDFFCSLANGKSVKKSIWDGLLTGLYGGIITGINQGIEGASIARRQHANIWSGKGFTFDSEYIGPIPEYIIVGEGMEYSTEYAKRFSNLNFDTDMIGNYELHADGTVPKEYTKSGDIVRSPEKKIVLATTVYNTLLKKSDVFLYKLAFTSPEQLYLTMGHEYHHVFYNSLDLVSSLKEKHSQIYIWEYRQSQRWKFSGCNGNMYRTPVPDNVTQKSRFYLYDVISSRPFLP